jgi:ABC-type transporter MlaC component
MSYSVTVKMRKLASCFVVGAAVVALASPARAQTKQTLQSQPASPTEPSSNPELSAKIEAANKSEPESELKTESSAQSTPQSTPSIDAFIAKLDSATRAIHKNSKNDAALISVGCRQLLNEVLDLDAMAKAANNGLSEKMSAPQRETFRSAFEHRMVASCVRQFGTYAGEKLQLAGVRPTDDGQLLATVRVGSQDDAKLVTWRLHNSGPQIWRAVDVISDGRSAVLDAHNEFAAVLQSFGGDIEALIAFMQK